MTSPRLHCGARGALTGAPSCGAYRNWPCQVFAQINNRWWLPGGVSTRKKTLTGRCICRWREALGFLLLTSENQYCDFFKSKFVDVNVSIWGWWATFHHIPGLLGTWTSTCSFKFGTFSYVQTDKLILTPLTLLIVVWMCVPLHIPSCFLNWGVCVCP